MSHDTKIVIFFEQGRLTLKSIEIDPYGLDGTESDWSKLAGEDWGVLCVHRSDTVSKLQN